MEGLINGKAGYFGVRIVELILTLFVVSFFTFALLISKQAIIRPIIIDDATMGPYMLILNSEIIEIRIMK